jgi:hypothetical protein
MLRRILIAAVALGFIGAFLPLTAQDVNISGTWDLTTQTPRGERTSPAVFEQTGETLKVTMTSPRGDEMTGTGTIKGQDVEWTITRTTPRGEMTMTYKGKVQGDTMSGEVQMGDFGAAPWTAKKKTS